MPTKVAAERVGLGCGGRVDVERVELVDSSEEQRSLEDRRGELVENSEKDILFDVSAKRGESSVQNVSDSANVSNVQNVK